MEENQKFLEVELVSSYYCTIFILYADNSFPVYFSEYLMLLFRFVESLFSSRSFCTAAGMFFNILCVSKDRYDAEGIGLMKQFN